MAKYYVSDFTILEIARIAVWRFRKRASEKCGRAIDMYGYEFVSKYIPHCIEVLERPENIKRFTKADFIVAFKIWKKQNNGKPIKVETLLRKLRKLARQGEVIRYVKDGVYELNGKEGD